MKKHLTTATALGTSKKAYHKPSLKSFGKVSVLTRNIGKGSKFDSQAAGGGKEENDPGELG